MTIVYDEAKKEQLAIEPRGTEGLQKYFEQRSYVEGGVPFSEASAVLVPRNRVGEVKRKLAARGFGHIDVRSTEELEARRVLEKLGAD